jgi:hypothetical protein
MTESAAERDARLTRALKEAQFDVLPGVWTYIETDELPTAHAADALAMVRDGRQWSALVPASGGEAERFSVCCFHFPPGCNNSGFIGWLASMLKARVGAGAIVLCGCNSARGGIFDYWGVGEGVAARAFEEIRRLRA